MPAPLFEPTSDRKPNPFKNGCVFCRILAGDLPGQIVYQDEQVSAFWDTHPAADVHILIVPNRHIASINELEASDENLAGHMILAAQWIAAEQGIAQSGYRLLINNGRQAGQSIDHLHIHLLSAGIKRPIA